MSVSGSILLIFPLSKTISYGTKENIMQFPISEKLEFFKNVFTFFLFSILPIKIVFLLAHGFSVKIKKLAWYCEKKKVGMLI